jgi:hypothetical protein
LVETNYWSDVHAMKTKSMHSRIYNLDENSYFRADSALLDFLGLALRAPESSFDARQAKPFVVRVRRTRRLGRSKSAKPESPTRTLMCDEKLFPKSQTQM